MATTVTYKGNTIATVNNTTKTLQTAGKYMEDDVTLVDVSGGASAISVIDELDVHGGTIRHINAVDLSNDTVTAAHLEYGYTAHDSQGEAITGTLVPGSGTQAGTVTQDVNGFLILDDEAGGGGGSSGLVYETGTWTPTEDVADYTITFMNTHTNPPFHYEIIDATGDDIGTDASNLCVAYTNWYYAFGEPIYYNGSTARYGEIRLGYKNSATTMGNSNQYITSASETTWASSTGIRAYVNNISRYWRSTRTYKWIAVWPPTT